MEQNNLEKKLSKIYLSQLLAFIFVDEICNNYFLNIFDGLSSKIQEFSFYLFFLIVQILFSPIQSTYSDLYCRKKSLVISLFASALSLIPAYLYFKQLLTPIILLGMMSSIKGIFGNNLPLSWAAIADTQNKSVRLSLALSTSAMALGYLGLILLRKMFGNEGLVKVIFFMFIILSFICAKKFFDIRDKKYWEKDKKISFSNEIRLLVNNFLKSRRFRKGLLTFIYWEISFYSIHMLDVDLKIKEFKGLTLAMILGYLVGVTCLWKFSKKKDHELIKYGFIISILSFLPIFILTPIVSDIEKVIISCYFFYALGSAFLIPSLFSTLSNERKASEQGKIYGLLDSADTIAFLVATLITMGYHWIQMNQFFIVFFSFTVFLLSWWSYAAFKKTSTG